jgi:hypothetical protein
MHCAGGRRVEKHLKSKTVLARASCFLPSFGIITDRSWRSLHFPLFPSIVVYRSRILPAFFLDPLGRAFRVAKGAIIVSSKQLRGRLADEYAGCYEYYELHLQFSYDSVQAGLYQTGIVPVYPS